ncbi:MAG: chemotaxis protein CheW [Myxococcales bacterium]|nr:chemotaxis protein CheW [Myxococcales bacterium]
MSEATPLQRAAWESLARDAALGRARDGEEAAAICELLAFDVGETVYAVPIERVREILRIRPITPMPHVPDVIRGVISIRGEVVEVVDLRRRMRLEPIEADRRTRIIVVHGEDGRVTGCMVDQVREVMRVPEDSIQPAAEADLDSVSGLCRRGDAFVSMLDLDKVLNIGRDG